MFWYDFIAVPLMERGLDYWKIEQTDVFELIALLGSFNRKQELDNARHWFTNEVRQIVNDSKPKNAKNSQGETIAIKPVNQNLVIDDLIANKFES